MVGGGGPEGRRGERGQGPPKGTTCGDLWRVRGHWTIYLGVTESEQSLRKTPSGDRLARSDRGCVWV